MPAESQLDYDHWWSSEHWCNIPLDDAEMNFRLIYRGPLRPQGSATPRHKHVIRRHFHLQLSVLWNTVPFVTSIGSTHFPWQNPNGEKESITRIEKLARQHVKGKLRFVPLISKELGLACSLQVLMLRREEPGEAWGGDLDNRFHVLIDALKIPDHQDLQGIEAEDGDDPFFCLLEDDSLLTDFQVKTDRLLIPADYPMASKIIADAAGALYECIDHGLAVSDRESWDKMLELHIERESERQKTEREVWMVINVKPLIADPRVAYSEFAY